MAQLCKVVFALGLIKLVINPLTTLTAYDPSLSVNDICVSRCDHHRARGFIGAFNFDCDQYSTEEEWDDCRNDCKECPTMCHFEQDPNSYHCPETQLIGECKNFCDQHRKNGSIESYQISCYKLFKNPDDLAHCKRICYGCPDFICDFLDDRIVFHCPMNGHVPPASRKPRPPRTTTPPTSTTTPTTKTSNITLAITSYSSTEESGTDKPRRMGVQILGRSLDGPAAEQNATTEESETTEHEDRSNPVVKTSKNVTRDTDLSYEGPCKTRCDKFRLGGNKEYDFKCDDLFETDKERDKCKLDCLECPRKICPRKLNFVFLCPKSTDHADQLDLGPLGLVFLITTVILAFVCVTLLAFYCCRRSSHGRLVSEDVTTSGHQIEYLHHVPQQRKKNKGNHQPQMKIVSSSDSMF